MRGPAQALACSAALGLAMTGGDLLWDAYITRDEQRLPAALAHGVGAFALIACLLAACTPAGSRRWRLAALPPAGLLIAGGFYPVARLLGYVPALLVCWVAMWLVFAASQWSSRVPAEPLRRALARGVAASLLSGLAFYSVAWMWTAAGADTGPATRVLCWTWAFAPGFAALLIGQPTTTARA